MLQMRCMGQRAHVGVNMLRQAHLRQRLHAECSDQIRFDILCMTLTNTLMPGTAACHRSGSATLHANCVGSQQCHLRLTRIDICRLQQKGFAHVRCITFSQRTSSNIKELSLFVYVAEMHMQVKSCILAIGSVLDVIVWSLNAASFAMHCT